MNEKLYGSIIQSLISSTDNVFQSMIFMKVKPQPPFERKGLDSLSDITGVISITGDIMGSVILSLNTDTAQKAISSMLGDQIDNEQEIIDGVGEISNMIVGMAKTELANLSCDFEISVPVMVTGKGVKIKHLSTQKRGLTTIPFITEDESILHLQLYLKDD